MMATSNDTQANSPSSMALFKPPRETETSNMVELGGNDDEERFLPPLPSVEQMQKDVANATSELQQAFFYPQNLKTGMTLQPVSIIIKIYACKMT